MYSRQVYVSVLFYRFDSSGHQISGLEVFRKTFPSLIEARNWVASHQFPKDWEIDEIRMRVL